MKASQPDAAPRVTVCVRKRPLNPKEEAAAETDIVSVVSGTTIHVYEPKIKVDLTKHVVQHEFMFDSAFNEDSSNNDVFQRTARPLVEFVVAGGKASCFAFGQTGSGKTHTMMGHREEKGLYLLAAQHLFSTLRAQGLQLQVGLSFFEIYADELYDLLNARTKLHAREDAKKRVVVQGLTEKPVRDPQDIMRLMEEGSAQRATGSTGANEWSSRSHAVMQLILTERGATKVHGKISFIDLAGSERGADTYHNDKKTRLEGAEINKSLLALKECIRAMDMDSGHTPFRGSKLTQVLKDSFIGSGRTAMIANIAPTSSSSEHSLNSLRYADRVKQLRKGTGVPAVGKVVAAAAAESIENCDPNEERRVSKELCLQDVVFPIDDDMSSGGDDFLPQLDDGGDVSDADSLDAAMCSGQCDVSTSSFKVHSVPVKRPNSAKKPTKKAAQMKASDLLQEFRSALHDSMGLMEREVALLDRMERLVHLSPDAQQVRDSCDEMFAIVAAKIDMAQRVQQHLNTFRSRD